MNLRETNVTGLRRKYGECRHDSYWPRFHCSNRACSGSLTTNSLVSKVCVLLTDRKTARSMDASFHTSYTDLSGNSGISNITVLPSGILEHRSRDIKYPYSWKKPNFMITQCRMGGRKFPCQKKPSSIRSTVFDRPPTCARQTDRQTDTQTDTGRHRAVASTRSSIASRGKKNCTEIQIATIPQMLVKFM